MIYNIPNEILYFFGAIGGVLLLYCTKKLCVCCIAKRRHDEHMTILKQQNKQIELQKKSLDIFTESLKKPTSPLNTSIVQKNINKENDFTVKKQTPKNYIYKTPDKIRQEIVSDLIDRFINLYKYNDGKTLTIEDVYFKYNNFKKKSDIFNIKLDIDNLISSKL